MRTRTSKQVRSDVFGVRSVSGCSKLMKVGEIKLVERGELYTERYSVGQFRLYFALESGEGNTTVRVWDVDKGFNHTVTAYSIMPYKGFLETEQIESIERYKKSHL